MNPSTKAYLYLYLVVFFWGGNFIVSRAVSSNVIFEHPLMSGILYGFFRYFIGGLFLFTFLIGKKENQGRPPQALGPIILGVIAAAVFVASSHMSHERISGGASSVIINLNPVAIYLIALALGWDKYSKSRFLGLFIAVTGISIFVLKESHTANLNAVGVILSLLAMLAWSIYTLSIHRVNNWSPIKTVAIMQITGAIMLIPFLALEYHAGRLNLSVNLYSMSAILFGGIVSSGTAHYLYLRAIQVLGPAKASAMLILVPLVGIFGDWILGELPQISSLVGAAIALGGVLIVKYSKSN